jgi:hypothetical protein
MEALAQKLMPLVPWAIGIPVFLVIVLIAVKVNKANQFKPPKQ